jgi:putative nucleotidyltransferase with HDIG domain
MNRRLRVLLGCTALGTAALLAAVSLSSRPSEAISVNGTSSGILAGIGFWVVLTLFGSSLPVRMPSGSTLDIAFAPLVATMTLGGAAVAGWVSLIGTTHARELRGEVPWYGMVANRCVIIAPSIAAAAVLQAIPARGNPAADFLATTVAATICFSLNVLLTAAFVSLREGQPIARQLRSTGGAFLTMLALAPVAWLMAQVYITAGWWAVLLFAVPLYMYTLASRRFVEVREMFTETVSSLAAAVDKRDQFTIGHSRNVQEIAMDIGRVMKVSDTDLEALEWGGLLHDIGKIGVPDSVLLKQERLTREERAIMNLHPVKGAEIIAPVTHLAAELPIIRHHHEWFNGSGYPDRLIGDEIPKLARILHVADAFEAMTAARPYRTIPLKPEQALAELRKFGGIQFDPDVVDAFVKTKWARGLADPGTDAVREVPMIGEAAVSIVSLAGATPTGTSI